MEPAPPRREGTATDRDHLRIWPRVPSLQNPRAIIPRCEEKPQYTNSSESPFRQTGARLCGVYTCPCVLPRRAPKKRNCESRQRRRNAAEGALLVNIARAFIAAPREGGGGLKVPCGVRVRWLTRTRQSAGPARARESARRENGVR